MFRGCFPVPKKKSDKKKPKKPKTDLKINKRRYVVFRSKTSENGADYGRIYFCDAKYQRLQVAVKTCDGRKEASMIKNEAKVLRKLYWHPNISEFIDFSGAKLFSKPYLVIRYFEGPDLCTFITLNNGRLREKPTQQIGKQILRGLEYVHSKKFAHLDIKPENILVKPAAISQGFCVKIIDFGFSRRARGKVEAYCGTPDYTAPEVHLFEPYDGFKADVWSYGVVIHKCLTGECLTEASAFFRMTTARDVEKVMAQDLYPSETCKDLMRRIFKVEPEERAGLKEVMNHRWFKNEKYKYSS